MKRTTIFTVLFLIFIPAKLTSVPPTALGIMDEMQPKIRPTIPSKPATTVSTKTVNERAVTINTKITNSMINYSYFGVSYTPDFNLKINNIAIKSTDSKKINIANNKMKIRYDYNFSGFKKGAKEVVFEIPQEVESIDITFSWDNRWRVIANKAKPRKIKVIA